MNGKISLAGDLGSGKSTVSRILMKKLGFEYFSTGAIVRAMAAERSLTVVEMNEYMEKHPEMDREIDDRLVALSDDPRALIIDSRMAFHFVRDTFRVYFSTDIDTSAARIMSDHRAEESFATLEETAENIRRRKKSERKRYFDFYGVDCKDLRGYDLVIDTTYATPEQIADYLIMAFEEWQKNKDRRVCYLSPCRPLYPEDIDMEEASRLTEMLARDVKFAPIEVYEQDGTFYVSHTSGDIAVAYSLNDEIFLPCTLVEGAPPKDIDYVPMANSL